MAKPSHHAADVCLPAKLTDDEWPVDHNVSSCNHAFHDARPIQRRRRISSLDLQGALKTGTFLEIMAYEHADAERDASGAVG
jgi:hypothetical protein